MLYDVICSIVNQRDAHDDVDVYSHMGIIGESKSHEERKLKCDIYIYLYKSDVVVLVVLQHCVSLIQW